MRGKKKQPGRPVSKRLDTASGKTYRQKLTEIKSLLKMSEESTDITEELSIEAKEIGF